MASRAMKPANAETVEDVLNDLDANATLHGAMAMAFAEIEAATKSADNPFFKSKYADLGSIIGTVKPALVRHGLFFTQCCHPSESGVIVETVLHHAGGESMSLGQLYVPANKHDAQGFGSAQTYARRYALQTAFGVPTEDDDGNLASRPASHPTTGETPPNKRVKLDGPYTCPTQLMKAAKEFVRTLHGLGSFAEFEDWRSDPEVKAFVAQLRRDLPDWWTGGPSVPADFTPLQAEVDSIRRGLLALEESA
jgi:hypothetical protein